MGAPKLALEGITALAAGLFWPPDEAVLMVWAYYDESGEYDAAGNLLNMTVGGCVAPLVKWQAFESQWKAALAAEGLISFHMTDFEAWRPPFDFKLASGERDYEKHKRLLNNLLDVMFAWVEGLYGFAAVRLDSHGRRAHRLTLEDCIIGAVSHAVQEVWHYYQRPVNLVFARQEHFPESEIRKIIWLYDFGDGKDRIKTESVANVEDVCALQAADIFAYEMSRVQRADRPERYPFRRMVETARAGKISMTLKWGPVRSGRADFSRGTL